MTTPTGFRLHAALEYAGRGWHVFPLAVHTKVPREGFDEWNDQASDDPDQIRAWWTEDPRYNIAIACGPSRLAVVDVDDAEGLDAVLQNGRHLARTLSQITPRGGAHYVYRAPPWSLRNKTGRLPGVGDTPGIDLRADGGYIVAAPSHVIDRREKIDGCYEWLPASWATEPAPCPSWLREPPPRPKSPARFTVRTGGKVDGLARTVENALPKQANNTLFWAANRAIEGGLGLDSIRDAAARRGKSEREIEATINSALKGVGL